MRIMLNAAVAAAAIYGMSMSLAAAMDDPPHVPGGPVREGNLCWVSTQSDNGFGYWKQCPTPEKAMHHKKK